MKKIKALHENVMSMLAAENSTMTNVEGDRRQEYGRRGDRDIQKDRVGMGFPRGFLR